MPPDTGTESITAEADLLGNLPRLSTGAAPDTSLATAPVVDSYSWSEVRDTLLKWLGNPLMLEDNGIDAPTKELLKSAIDFSRYFAGIPAPTSVAPTPDGGISFEWRQADDLEIAEIVQVGMAEHTVISGGSVRLHEVLRRILDGRWEQVEQ